MEAPPPRLTVLAARDADRAVVLRRGPSEWARLSLWDTAEDTVEHGGWLRARVDGRRCDLSPDGALFGAFVAGHGRHAVAPAPAPGHGHGRGHGHGHGHDTWVAVSRPPWWRALALWFDGTTWNHGVFFPDSRSCAGGGGPPDEGEVPEWFDAGARLPEPRPGRQWTTRSVPHNRRLRDGWTSASDGWWERTLAEGGVAVLRELDDPASHTGVEVALRWGGELVPLGADASLDVDRRGRALVARHGRLEVHSRPGATLVVDDLTTQRPEPGPAPAWARQWPGRPGGASATQNG